MLTVDLTLAWPGDSHGEVACEMRVTGDDKSSAFTSWLRDRGVELTPGDLSVVAGFVALAGRRPVTAEDIERGTALARDAAISDDAQLEWLGAHLLAFEAAHPPTAATNRPDSPDAAPETNTVETITPETITPETITPETITAEPITPETIIAEPITPETVLVAVEQPASSAGATATAPLKIMIRATTRVPIVEQPAATEHAVVQDASDHSSPRTSLWQTRGKALVAALVAATMAGAIYVRHRDDQRASEPPAPSPRISAPAAAQRLRKLDLGVRLPAGWREASDAELGTLTVRRDAAVVFRGATPSDPDHGVFVAAAAVLDSDLVAAARTAERGIIQQFGVDTSAYHPAGCAAVELGSGHAGRCRGFAEHPAGRIAVEIYVRPVGGRNVVALSLARSSLASADAETLAIVASFTP